MALQCGCNLTQLVPRIQVPEGTDGYPFIYPAVDRNGVFTIDSAILQLFQAEWVGVAGNGIELAQGGSFGHTPTISVCVNPDSPVPLEFVDVNGTQCLSAQATNAGETLWTSPNTVTAEGITVTAGGTNGHSPSFAIAIGAGAPFEIDANGALNVTADLAAFTCASLNGCSISNLGDVQFDGTQQGGDLLAFTDNGILTNTAAATAVGQALSGEAGATIPAPPATGAAVTLQWNPATQTFAWVTSTGGGGTPVTCDQAVTSGGQAFTGTAVGVWVFSCADAAMPTGTGTGGGVMYDPEIGYPAADFPVGWVQQFTEAFTGTETWMVQTTLDNTTSLWVEVTGMA